MKKEMIFIAILLFFTAGAAAAKDFTLAWEANPEPNVTGYRIYYKSASSTLPFDGSGAAEGASPIDVGNTLTADLTGLADDETYYFAVTAYNAEGLESTLSNIVASDWVPQLLAPAADEAVAPDEVMFRWGEAPGDIDVTYTLYYGTNPTLTPTLASSSFQSPAAMAGVAVLGLFGMLAAPRRRMKAVLLLALLILPLSLAACGGGGGGGSDPAPIEGAAPAAPDSAEGSDASRAAVQMIGGLADTYYTAVDLKPSTRYYWKVVATDAAGHSYESVSGSFTTGK